MLQEKRKVLQKVVLIEDSQAPVRREIGGIEYFTQPPRSSDDYSISPAGIVPEQAAELIAECLRRNVVIGKVGDLEWRED